MAEAEFKCTAPGCGYVAKSNAGLWSHQRQHNLPPNKAITKNGATPVKGKSNQIAKAAKAPMEASNGKNHGLTAHVAPVELIAYTVGNIERTVHEVAFQEGVPAKHFAQECAEYFLRISRR